MIVEIFLDEYLISKKLSTKDFKLTAAISLTQIKNMPHIQRLKDIFEIQVKILVSKYGYNEKIEFVTNHLISNLTVLIITLIFFLHILI